MKERDISALLREDTPGAAVIDGTNRYALSRSFDGMTRAAVLFIMLNPSYADAATNDHTITKCVGFAQRWGFGRLLVGNLYPLRSTDPKALCSYTPSAEHLQKNDEYLHAMLRVTTRVVLAWGAHSVVEQRAAQVIKLAGSLSHTLFCLGVTRDGCPKHPLRLGYATGLRPYAPKEC